MSKNIKVGDSIRILDVDNIENGIYHWKNGDIIKIIGEDSIDFHVETTVSANYCYYIRKKTELQYIEKVEINTKTVNKIIRSYGGNNKEYLGIIGEDTGEVDTNLNKLHVGDIVSFIHSNKVYTNVVMKHPEYKESYGIYGFGINKLKLDGIKKVLSYDKLTNEILSELITSISSYQFKIIEVEVPAEKEMTLEEIERELGYKIKIISNKEEEQ